MRARVCSEPSTSVDKVLVLERSETRTDFRAGRLDGEIELRFEFWDEWEIFWVMSELN